MVLVGLEEGDLDPCLPPRLSPSRDLERRFFLRLLDRDLDLDAADLEPPLDFDLCDDTLDCRPSWAVDAEVPAFDPPSGGCCCGYGG